MKKKVQEKKCNNFSDSEIVQLFTPGIFWEYRQQPAEQLTQIDNFLTNFDKELRLLLVDPSIQGNFKILVDKIGICCHPSLTQRKKSPQFKSISEQGYGERYAIFLNHKIDQVTLKLLSYVLTISKPTALKFSNNSLTEDELKAIISILSKDDTSTTIFFQWNPLTNYSPATQQSLVASILRPNLTSLILRSCQLGDNHVKDLLSRISPESKLRYLDLYDNNLSGDISTNLSKLLEENKSIQYLGLSKNKISSKNNLELVFNSIGNIKLSADELTNYRKLEKQRDEIIQKNKKKKKGAPDEPVPFLLKIQQIDSEWFYMKNSKLKGMTLAWNDIPNECCQTIKDFLMRVSPNLKEATFQLVLTGNSFNKMVIEQLSDIPCIKI